MSSERNQDIAKRRRSALSGLSFAVLLLLPLTGAADITRDTPSSAAGDFVDTLTWTHTVGSGSDRYLIVAVALKDNTAVSGVTFNGTALTLIGARFNGQKAGAEMWGTIAPATGTFNVVVAMSKKT